MKIPFWYLENSRRLCGRRALGRSFGPSTVAMRRAESLENRILLAATFNMTSVGAPSSALLGAVTSDFNGDGNQDFAVSSASGYVYQYTGNGLGGFSSTVLSPALSGAPREFGIAAGNLQGSALPEIVVGSDNVAIRLMTNSSGVFSNGSLFSAGSATAGVAIGDLNGDGFNDIAVARYNSSSVRILHLNSSGSLIGASTWSVGARPFELKIADVTGDGKNDVVVANTFSNTVTVLSNLGGGASPSFSAANFDSGGYEPHGIEVIDLSGDNLPDIAVTNYASGSVSYLKNLGSGSFTVQSTVSIFGSPIGITSLDFDRDGRTDLAVADGSGLVRILRNSISGLALDSAFSTGSVYEISTADFNNDGRADLVASGWYDSKATILLGTTNSLPTNITLNSDSVTENSAIGSIVGSFTAADLNSLDSHTFSLVSGVGATNNADFSISGNSLLISRPFDFESEINRSVRVRASDPYGGIFEKVFTINVTDINESPTDISLSNSSVAENLPSGTSVGNLATTDPDAGNTFTYSLVTGTGDADNGSFTIDGNTLKTAAVFNFETKSSYSIRVRSTDQGGLSFEKVFTINVLNVTELGGIDVQRGQSQRSYVRYLDILFDRPDDILDMINNGRFQLTKRDLNELNPVNVPLTPSMFSRVGNSGRIDFGTNGLGGNRNSNVGDGYYQMGIDMDGNGSFESTRSFYRLLGDVNGDRKVDSTDSSLVTSSFGLTSPERDVNGDGYVNSNDRTLVLRAIGRKLKEDLFADD